MSEPNKDGTDMMMAMLMGLSGPRASRAWTEAQEIQAMSFLTLAEHWINETATEIVRVKGENAHLKAEVDNLRKNADISPSQSPHEIERLCAWGRGLESDLSHARVEISFLKAEVERLDHQVRYWRIEAEVDNARWLRCLEDLEKLRKDSQP